jgi:hypothetical protein
MVLKCPIKRLGGHGIEGDDDKNNGVPCGLCKAVKRRCKAR